jgi:hypothetical protein
MTPSAAETTTGNWAKCSSTKHQTPEAVCGGVEKWAS